MNEACNISPRPSAPCERYFFIIGGREAGVLKTFHRFWPSIIGLFRAYAGVSISFVLRVDTSPKHLSSRMTVFNMMHFAVNV